MSNYIIKRAENLKTPCFIIDEEELVDNIQGFTNALNKFFPKGILGYSVKTNSLPYIINLAKENGCFAEIVSADEFELIKQIGFTIDRIIYNGPMKSKETFTEAVLGGAFVNIENDREIEWLKDIIPPKNYRLGIRVNINLARLGVDGEILENSRFGFSYENGELQKAIQKISSFGFRLNGIHAHRTSTTREVNVYRKICEYLSNIVKKLRIDLNYVDIGGGFFGNMPGKPNYIEYVSTIRESLNISNSEITLILEPGNGLIASPIEYMFSIMDCKKIDGQQVCSTDGTRLDVDPFFHKTEYFYERVGKVIDREIITQQILTGSTCLEKDVIMELEKKESFLPGDRLVFKNVGAYTMTLTPNFINYLPTVYRRIKGGYVTVRKKWTAELVMKNNNIDNGKGLKDSILFTNAGRRAKLMTNFIESIGEEIQIIATDNWSVAPALFTAHKYYLTPKIRENNYIDSLLEICRKEHVKAITSLIDPEIQLLARNSERFKSIGVIPLCPSEASAELCFDKYKMFQYLSKVGIRTIMTYNDILEFKNALVNKEIKFPVFIKPRTGSGSVGAKKINNIEELEVEFSENEKDYIIQEYMDCEDCDVDVYIDTLSHKLVAAFSKKKIETKIGGASKTISFKDEKLFEFINQIVDKFEFSGAVDMDFFYRDGEYYLSEINPRFGGAYLHAYGAGVDFPKMIRNNIRGIENKPCVGNYKEDVIMLMYDEVVITNLKKLKGDYKNEK